MLPRLLENMTGIKGQTDAPGSFQRSSVTSEGGIWLWKSTAFCQGLAYSCLGCKWDQVCCFCLERVLGYRIMQHTEWSQLENNLERGSGLSFYDWRETGALCYSLHKNSTPLANSGKAEASSSNCLASRRFNLGVNATEQNDSMTFSKSFSLLSINIHFNTYFRVFCLMITLKGKSLHRVAQWDVAPCSAVPEFSSIANPC